MIPNWNGEIFLPRCLTTIIDSAKKSGKSFDIIVVDDASDDSSRQIVEERFRSVKLIRNQRNLGFAKSVNRGARRARGRILILCNNDLAATGTFISELAKWFDDGATLPNGVNAPLFGVSAKTIAWYDGNPNQLCMGALWRGGRLSPAWSDPESAGACLFVQAGAAAYNRKLFNKLGGLSKLYEPAYWEDYDLSYRAAMQGWGNLYDPKAIAIHHGGGSMIKRYGQEKVNLLRARNHLLFEVARISDFGMLAEWMARIVWGVSREILKSREEKRLIQACWAAIPHLARAQRERFRTSRHLSDAEILEPFRKFKPSDD